MKLSSAIGVGAVAWGIYLVAGGVVVAHVKPQKAWAKLVGNGKYQVQSRKMASYSKVVVGSAFQGEFSEGKPSDLKIGADSNLLPHIKSEVRGGTLYITTEGSISTKSKMTVSGGTAQIIALNCSGASQINLKNIGDHDLKLMGSGASQIKVSGRPQSYDIDLSGASVVTLPKLQIAKLNIELSGASKLVANGNVADLVADLSGASSIMGPLTAKTAKVDASGASNANLKVTGKSNVKVSGVAKVSER